MYAKPYGMAPTSFVGMDSDALHPIGHLPLSRAFLPVISEQASSTVGPLAMRYRSTSVAAKLDLTGFGYDPIAQVGYGANVQSSNPSTNCRETLKTTRVILDGKITVVPDGTMQDCDDKD